jgi:hypothetical protein
MRNPAHRLLKLAALAFVPLAMLMQPQKADALLSYYIFEEGGSTKLKSIGSVVLPAPAFHFLGDSCYNGFFLDSGSSISILGTGTGVTCDLYGYPLTTVYLSSSFSGEAAANSGVSLSGSAFSGIDTNNSRFLTLTSYVSGSSLANEVIFASLASPLVGSGLIAEWAILDESDPFNPAETDHIKLYLSAPPVPPSASVPAPLPLAGASLAFGWSRRLRRRAGKTSLLTGG